MERMIDDLVRAAELAGMSTLCDVLETACEQPEDLREVVKRLIENVRAQHQALKESRI